MILLNTLFCYGFHIIKSQAKEKSFWNCQFSIQNIFLVREEMLYTSDFLKSFHINIGGTILSYGKDLKEILQKKICTKS